MAYTSGTPEGELPSKLRRSLEDWDVVSVVAEINKEEHRQWLGEHGWELVPLICGYLSPPEVEAAAPHLTQCCQDLLLVVADRANPKESLVAFLEQLETFRSAAFLRRCLPALSPVLLKIKDKSKAHSWSWALSTVSCSLETLSLPESQDLEGKERLAADLSEASAECIATVEVLLDFVQPLVDHALKEKGNEHAEQGRVLRNFLLRICDRPLAYLQQHPETSTPRLTLEQSFSRVEPLSKGPPVHPKSFESASKVVKNIGRLTANPLGDIIELDLSVKDDEDKISQLAVASYLYLLLGEELGREQVPSVYSPYHLLMSCSRHLTGCLLHQSRHNVLAYKGVLLLQALLQRSPPGQLDKSEAENPSLLNLFQPLIGVIVYNGAADCRKTGFDCYKMLVELFTVDAKYYLYLFLLKTINHSGLLGWTITHLKDTLLSIHLSKPPSHYGDPIDGSYQYSGERIEQLVGPLFTLKHGAETDLLEISDELIASINLAIMLLAVDQKKSAAPTPDTGVTTAPTGAVSFSVGEKFNLRLRAWAAQIQEGLNLSRAHYELKLREDSVNNSGELSVNVGGVALPAMEPERMRHVVRLALNTFDLIKFNLVGLLKRLD